jgi:formylglycine-generating enzyme required for sulfatase activity
MDDLGIPPKDPQREGSQRDHAHRIVLQGDYWRGDLLRTMLFFEINHRDFISFALERGYDYEPVASIEEPLIPPSSYQSNKELVEERINDSPSVIRPVSERFWVPRIYLVDRFSPEMDLGVDGLDKTQSSDVAVISSEHVQQPQVKYLAAWPELRNRLDPLLGFPKRTRRLDAEALIKRISRGDPIRQIPFYQRKRLQDQITVIKEHALHCAPYRLDQEMVVEHFSQATVRGGLQVLDAFFPYGLSNPAFDDSSLVIRQQEMEPTPGSHILILGDLGLLLKIKDAFDQDAVEWWYRACRRWSSLGCKVFALVPFGCERVPARLRAWIEPIAWQGDAVRSLTHTQQEQGVTRLLTMAYPAQQIEPGLLRELRRLIPGLEDASLEARFWQDGRHGGPRYDAVKQTQASMRSVYKTQFEELGDSTITDILRRIRQYRIARGFSILWQMELMNLPKRLRDLIDPNSKEQELAIQTYQALCFQMLQGGTSGLQDRLMSLSIHASEHAIEDANIGSAVRTIKNRCLPDAKRSDKTRLPEVPPSIEMRKVQIECKPTGIRFLEVRQAPMDSIAIGSSNCVTMTSGKPVLELYVPGGSMDQQIRSFWKSGKKPEWVSDFGIDQYGAWCEFQVPRHGSKGVVTQRMRWIKPGQFMMGSPDTEQGRKSNESPQHQVTLTQGFWMADSQVTQELWRAISGGKNPSFYRNALSPVNGVNWDDCQIWIRELRKHHESLKIALPTEAQWEYACRAGSTTAYCFGDDPEELPKYGWFAGNPGLLTSSVKHLLPNDWGLYDMHGNVWEWCSDWYDYYKKVPSLDPSGPSKGTGRVVRGGDWGSPFRRLRSACRVGYDPSYRDFHMGFRLQSSAQGAEPSEGAMLGEFLSQRGQPRDGGKAQEKYQRSREIHERLLEQNPQSAEAVRDVAASLNNVGDFLSRRGQPEKALENYLRSLEVRERLLEQNPQSAEAARDLAVSLNNVGDCLSRRGQPGDGGKALENHLRSLEVLEQLLHQNPQSAEAARYLAVSLNNVGDCLSRRGQPGDGEKALENYLRSLDVRERLLEKNPQSAEAARDLAVSLNNVGDCLSRRGQPGDGEKALENYQRSLEVLERLLQQKPQSAEAARDVSASLNKVPEAERSTERARVGWATVEYGFLRSIDLDATVENSPEKKLSEIDFNAYTSIRVDSDQESYQFDRLEKPIWAVEFGSDQYGLHATFEVSTVRQRMRWIPPGRFLMGSPDGKNYGRRNEYPQHEVILTHGYWMFDTPCRQRLWSALMEKNSSYFVHEDRPVETIRWEEAVAFAKKLSERLAEGFPTSGRNLFDGWNRLQFRLPTEAEWEYACRAGTTGDTYAGNLEIQGDANAPLLDAIAWYGGNSGHEYDLDKSVSLERAWLRQRQFHNAAGGTRNVGTKAPNPWGLYDMLGNVWEWCNDWYADDIASLESVNPQGPTNGDRRVFRGGSWNSPARYLRSAYRHNHSILPMMSSHGFRLVFTPMANHDEALSAIEGLNQWVIAGRRVEIIEARPREERPPRRGGGGYGGGGGYHDRGDRSPRY